MSNDYTVIMYKADNWEDSRGVKRIHRLLKRLKEVTGAPCKPQVLSKWYQYIVIDLGSHSPEERDTEWVITGYSDSAWYYAEYAPWEIVGLGRARKEIKKHEMKVAVEHGKIWNEEFQKLFGEKPKAFPNFKRSLGSVMKFLR